jgi:hypothetical protein
LEDIDPDEIEKLCVEAELARKNHSIKQKVTAPNNFNTPIRDSASGDSTVGVEGSSTGPTQYERRIIKAPACKKSPYIYYILKVHYGLTRKKRNIIEITTKIRNICLSIFTIGKPQPTDLSSLINDIEV